MRFRRDLFSPPSYQAEGAHERRVTWLELFYDLVFVVAVGQIATRLSENYTWTGLAQAAFLFVVVWWAWIGQTFYLSRFDSDDLVHRSISMLQMFAVGGLAVSIPGALEDRTPLFVLAYGAIRGLLTLEYFRAGWSIPRARTMCFRYASGFGLAVILWLSSLAVPPEWRYGVWALALAVDYAVPQVFWREAVALPPRVHHLPERFGLFTIIVLGETVLSVLIGLGGAKLTPNALVTSFFAWLMAFGIWWCYFDGVRGAESRPLNQSNQGQFRTWLYIHMPMQLGIVVAGIGVKKTILKPEALLAPPVLVGLVGGAFISMMAMNIMSRTSPEFQCDLIVRRQLVRHLSVSILTLGGFAIGTVLASQWLTVFIALMWLGHVFFAVQDYTPRDYQSGFELSEETA